MLSQEKAEAYLTEILNFPPNWRHIFDTNKLNFLRLYMKQHGLLVPFQNVTMAAIDSEKRKNPTVSDIVKQGLTGLGGCCLNLNYFTKILFEALGLEAFAIQGTHYMAPVAGTHCMVAVRLNRDELYLVEVGGSFPIMEPVPMHKLPFRILTAGGFPSEFRQMSEGLVGRFQIGGGLLGGQYIGKTESLRTSWEMKPREFSEYDHAMTETFTNPVNSGLLRYPMMCRYFFPGEVDELLDEVILNGTNNNGTSLDTEDDPNTQNNFMFTGNENFVFIFKQLVIIGDAKSRKLVKQFGSFDDMQFHIQKCFPMLPIADIEKALKTFNNYEVTPSPYDTIL